jgi:hypothetical protein
MGKATEAAIDAKETYFHIKRNTAHTIIAIAAQSVKYGQIPKATPKLVATPLPPLKFR